jgi:hypothetical protein
MAGKFAGIMNKIGPPPGLRIEEGQNGVWMAKQFRRLFM